MRNGWISPAGECFPCKMWEHREFAESLASKNGLWQNTGGFSIASSFATDYLIDNGWIHVSSDKTFVHIKAADVLKIRAAETWYFQNHIPLLVVHVGIVGGEIEWTVSSEELKSSGSSFMGWMFDAHSSEIDFRKRTGLIEP